MRPVIKYDPASDAAYIRLSEEAVVESAEVSENLVLDYDEAGHIVGMELLNARSQLSPSLLDVA
ncbi:hypothetical protein BJF93_11520 [Xaviernesmea oryzae]|uniref:DUF2283 domain-containing protein n=1 Tax=Xaviernesmea oryzae TaxID=464029 RepID=A0A1Q9AV68_9HYPH|nr:DUF2283 domain-containing protein [Xaviernesmea oryzae]OLP59357.1 hypothetical protein BJF93_11520 [Xaviernesmea oryzae]SEL63365.1 Uncharacterized protein YuzE [Xaviernesmea oryzae]